MQVKRPRVDFLVIAILIIILMKNKDFGYSPDVLLPVTILLQGKSITLRYAKIMQFLLILVDSWGLYTHEGLTITIHASYQIYKLNSEISVVLQ